MSRRPPSDIPVGSFMAFNNGTWTGYVTRSSYVRPIGGWEEFQFAVRSDYIVLSRSEEMRLLEMLTDMVQSAAEHFTPVWRKPHLSYALDELIKGTYDSAYVKIYKDEVTLVDLCLVWKEVVEVMSTRNK